MKQPALCRITDIALFVLAIAMTLAFVCVMSGCAAKKRTKVLIPKQCVQIKVTDFTKACSLVDNNTLMCDGVRVHASCVKYEEKPK